MSNQFPGNLLNSVNQTQNALNNSQPLNQTQQESFKSDGFLLPATFSADQNGLPYSQVPSYKSGQLNRNIITWFVPQFGTVRMYVNPSSISYNHKKLINKDRTKGGYTLQYWGEELTTINISGTTGSSGIEGINTLYEIYRAEQYAFDAVGLTLAGNNASADLTNNLINGVGGSLGSSVSQLFGGDPNSPTAAAGGAGLLGGILGLDSPNNNLSVQNIPSLAQLAFTVELYYGGWVYRGFFDSMTVNERADQFLIEYQMVFMATQRRGYRVNYFPWTRSAKDGPSAYTTPNSFSGNVTG
jgi:hypothetical protein